MIKSLVRAVLPKKTLDRLQEVRKQIKNFETLASGYGQWQTIRDWNSVDPEGRPIPWYTYPAIEYLSHLKLRDLAVFEYGSGNSTLWWASRAKHVVSVEDDEVWFEKINRKLTADNVKYHLQKEKNSYVAAAPVDSDIFIVDGKYRRECAEHIVSLREGVMLILDNSDWYPKTVDFLGKSLEWVQVDFHGFGPINNYTWTTSIFINPERHAELMYGNALQSKACLVQVAESDY